MTRVISRGNSTMSGFPREFPTKVRSMMHSRRKRRGGRAVQWLAIVMSLALAPSVRTNAGTIPANDDVLLATLPTVLVQQRESSRRAANAPCDVGATLKLVRVYLDADADSCDERYLDLAQELLAAWPVQCVRDSPSAILLAHAEIAQRAHRFDEARAALRTVLEREPDNVQALLMRAYVLITQGDSRAALEDCYRLRTLAAIDAVNCAARIRGLTGEAGRAYQDVLAELDRVKRAGLLGKELRELALTAADLAERL